MEGEKLEKGIIYILSDVIVAPGFMLLHSTSLAMKCCSLKAQEHIT